MDWGLILTTILAVAFFIISTILAIRLAKRKKPVWAYVTTKIIGVGTNAPQELKLTFNDIPVSDVFKTLIIFFNRGNQVINKDDVTKIVTISLEGARILRTPNVKSSNDEIEFSATEFYSLDNATIKLDFSYLDHNDGAIIELLHTEYKDIICSGNIKEVGIPRYVGEFIQNRGSDFYTPYVGFSLFTIGVAFLWYVVLHKNEINWVDVGMNIFMTLVFVVLLVFALVGGAFRYVSFPRWSRLKK